LQGRLDTLLQGQVPITLTGYFGTGTTGQNREGARASPIPIPPVVLVVPVTTATQAPVARKQGLPVYEALVILYTVKDA
jgi:hypothetical protein